MEAKVRVKIKGKRKGDTKKNGRNERMEKSNTRERILCNTLATGKIQML